MYRRGDVVVIGIFRKSTTGVGEVANMSVHVSKPFVGFVLPFKLLSNSQSADMIKYCTTENSQ